MRAAEYAAAARDFMTFADMNSVRAETAFLEIERRHSVLWPHHRDALATHRKVRAALGLALDALSPVQRHLNERTPTRDYELQHTVLIDSAVEAGTRAHRAEFAAIGDARAPPASFPVAVPVDKDHKRAIRELDSLGRGEFNAWHGDWEVRSVGGVQSVKVQCAGCGAFAAVLREACFKPTVRGILD